MKTLSLLSALFLISSIGCSDNSGSNAASSGGSTPSTTGVFNTSLETPLDASKSYRLAVLWMQIDDDGPDQTPDVALDVPFDANSKSIDVGELSAFKTPSERNVLCTRATNDKGVSPCLADSPYRVGFGIIVISEDVNKNGISDVGTRNSADQIALYARGALVYSEKGSDVLPPSKSTPDKPVFIDGTTQKGVHMYESYEPGGTFHRLKPFTKGSTLAFKKSAPNLT